MPAKKKPKSKKTKTEKKSAASAGKKAKKNIKKAKQTSAKKIKKEIEKAVDHIPEMIVEQVHFKSDNEENEYAGQKYETQKTIPQYVTKSHLKKRAAVWAGVILLTSVVFIMWFWNARSALYDIRNSIEESAETKILNSAKTDLRTIMESIAEGEDRDIDSALKKNTPEEEQIKNILLNMVGNILADSSSTTAVSTTAAATADARIIPPNETAITPTTTEPKN